MGNNSHQSFTELDVWKTARKLKIRIWKLVKTFPVEEKYRLCDQLIRSSRSIGTAIAEGHGKFYYRDQINYCVIARGSLSETLNHLIDAMDSEYISKDDLASFKIDIDATGKLLNGYINFLRIGLTNEKKKPGAKDTDENIEAHSQPINQSTNQPVNNKTPVTENEFK